jgi:hypothetical protein
MNPITQVLCVSAICLSIEGHFNWVGPILLVAFGLAMLEHLGRVAIWQKILKK